MQYRHVHTAIIDEISMVSAKTLNCIHRRLCSIFNTDQPYGNRNMIFVGDFLQLRPVRGHFAFTHSILWKDMIPFCLHENMRQNEDTAFSNILNRARVGQLTSEDIKIPKTTMAIPSQNATLDTPIHMFPTVKAVQQHNQQHQCALFQEGTTLNAIHYFSSADIAPKENVTSELIPDDDRDAGGLPNKLIVSCGTRVMLLRNLAVKQGLVNGAMGTIQAIDFQENVSAMPIHVIFDDKEIGRIMKNSTTMQF